ncbi:MAG: hypothetical protein ACKO0V_08835 [bacterium]
MNDRSKTAQWISDYLDDCISPEDFQNLEGWIQASAENARHFAREIAFHNELADRFRSLVPAEIQPVRAWPNLLAMPRRRLVKGLAASLLLIFCSLWWFNTGHLDAAAGLDQLIAKSTDLGDRTYVIASLDREPEKSEGRRPPIDRASLYVRGLNQYVLVRKYPDGRHFTTGYDGSQNWSVPPDGAVRLSRDPNRFRGPLPGHKHGVPFVDLRTDLIEIRDAFKISFSEADYGGLSVMIARKKPGVRGPREVAIFYDQETGIIHEMIFRGLPQAQGGPSNVSVTLVSQESLDPAFFNHQFHHDSAREVIQE